MSNKKKVMLGMSGGVDSSVAALLLLEQGYDVTGITMKLRSDDPAVENLNGGCCSLDDVADARRVANQLGIPHYVLNFTDLFAEKVMDYFAAAYQAGETPNPCIACNRHIKFDALLQKALAMEFDYIATGHYAVIEQGESGRWFLRKSPAAKDQSYVLYNLTQEQLAHTLMPLGKFSKMQARELAEKHCLAVAHKPDSQEICFVPDRDYAGFLERYTGIKAPEGNFVDEEGNFLGRHRGITHYTVGQRKGLGISFGKPMYVTRIDADSNQVVLAEEGGQYRSSLVAGDLNFIPFDQLPGPLRVAAKIRYQAAPAPALLTMETNGFAKLVFDQPQRSVTPGQAVVFYDGDLVLGGGIIQPLQTEK